jgi:hypothetical protein
VGFGASNEEVIALARQIPYALSLYRRGGEPRNSGVRGHPMPNRKRGTREREGMD